MRSVLGKSDEPQAAQATVHQQVHVALLSSAGFTIGTKEDGTLYAIPGKDR
jgi:hypothetical protein